MKFERNTGKVSEEWMMIFSSDNGLETVPAEVPDFIADSKQVESEALLQWQKDLGKINGLSVLRRPLEQQKGTLPEVQIVDNSGDRQIAPGNDQASTGSQASHDFATRVLSKSGGNGTLIARTLLDMLGSGTFTDQQGNARHYLTQDASEEWGRDFDGSPRRHEIGTVYGGPSRQGELHMRSVINDVVQKMGMRLRDGQLERSGEGPVEDNPQQVVLFNSECLRAFNAGEIPYLFQIRNMTEQERTAADNAQTNPNLRGTYHRALIVLTPDAAGTVRVPGASGTFRQTDYIPEAEAHMTHTGE